MATEPEWTDVVYEYDASKGFCYSDFLEKITPIVSDLIVMPDEANDSVVPDNLSEIDVVAGGKEDYHYEILQMFSEMGVDTHDGCKGFYFYRDMTYVDLVVIRVEPDSHGILHRVYYRMPANVNGTLIIQEHKTDYISTGK